MGGRWEEALILSYKKYVKSITAVNHSILALSEVHQPAAARFLHTTCLRFQLHQSTNHDGQCQDSTSKNRKLAVSAEHRPDGEETKKDTQRGRSSRLIKKPAYALFFHVLLSIG